MDQASLDGSVYGAGGRRTGLFPFPNICRCGTFQQVRAASMPQQRVGRQP